MTIIQPDYILTPHTLLEKQAVAFEKTIVAIGPIDDLKSAYPDAKIVTCKPNSLLMPGLINAHVHLEFSANKTTLEYGNFLPWLYSVIKNRDDLITTCNTECMQKAVAMMLHSGITTFGAISSHGYDLEAAEVAPQNVLFFNELIGSQAAMADALYTDFLERLDNSKKITREGFMPAIAIHSPYSVHPILIKRALEMATNENLPLSAHYMESPAEREWLDENRGDFAPFFKDFLNMEYAVNRSEEFLELFDDTPTLMTHVVHASKPELEMLKNGDHTVVHCPISNRLLGNGAIDLDALENEGISWLLATDGLSSNYTLDLFEEMKIALFMHHGSDLIPLAQKLIESVTCNAAKALNLNTGSIEIGKQADMLLFNLDEAPNEQLTLHLLLHRYPISDIFIRGKRYEGF